MLHLVDTYKKNPENKELEVRLRDISWENWRDAFIRCTEHYNSYQLEQSIVFITTEGKNVQSRKEIQFKLGVKQPNERHIRKKIIKESFKGAMKYSLSEELPINTFNSHSVSLVRLRLRASFVESWRIDFTFVQEVQPSQLSKLPEIKAKMFPNGKDITPKNFIEVIQQIGNPTDPQFRWELEFEYIDDPADLDSDIAEDQISEIIQVIDPDMSRNQKIHSLAKLFPEQGKAPPRTLKQFVNQPITLTYADYIKKIIPKIEQYFISDKADGERALLYIDGDTQTVELYKANEIIPLEYPAEGFKITGKTILDTEVLSVPLKAQKKASKKDKEKVKTVKTVKLKSVDGAGEPPTKIYVFDILMLNDRDMTNLPFLEREAELEKISAWLAPLTEKKIQVHLTKENFAKQLTELYNRETRMYPIDGIIFTPEQGGYFNMSVYKWKPPEKNTIDFLIIRAPKSVLGVAPYIPPSGTGKKELYFLLCGIQYQLFKNMNLEYFPGYKDVFHELGVNLRDNYFPIQFSPSEKPLVFMWFAPLTNESAKTRETYHGHIGEFRYNVEEETWELMKMRPDKDVNIQDGTAYGNDFRVAEDNFVQFFHPFTFETLVKHDPEAAGYFAEDKLEIYKPATKFNNFVKAQVIRQLENTACVVDLACGKGQDLPTESGFGIKKLICIDKDAQALAELSRRKYELKKPSYYVFNKPPKHFPTILTKELDLNESAKKTMHQLKDVIEPFGADGVIINLAIHYLISGESELENFIDLVDILLKPGGIFIFTCFSGERIFKILKETDFQNSWDMHQDEVLKYSIKRLYQSNSLTNFGQKIGVVHPFSKGEYYEEYLVNINMVITAFSRRGYQIRQNGSFADWLSKFQTFNAKVYEQMSPEDIKYVSLYQYVSLWKPQASKSKKKVKSTKSVELAEEPESEPEE
jgi:SAM-dependent methyltransferase